MSAESLIERVRRAKEVYTLGRDSQESLALAIFDLATVLEALLVQEQADRGPAADAPTVVHIDDEIPY